MLIVIPARLASTRLPGKMLLKLRGDKSVLQCTYERVLQSSFAAQSRIVIATDSHEIADEAKRFGARHVMMTKSSHISGSERAGEVLAATLQQPINVVVNVQGDEPFLDAAHIDLTIQSLLDNTWADAATVAVQVLTPFEQHEESKVKVVVDSKGSAMYFSRSPIPHGATTWLRHVGLYAFRPQVLQAFVRAKPTALERSERLEQLRLLELGYKMHVSVADECEFGGIDTLQDYRQALELVQHKP